MREIRWGNVKLVKRGLRKQGVAGNAFSRLLNSRGRTDLRLELKGILWEIKRRVSGTTLKNVLFAQRGDFNAVWDRGGVRGEGGWRKKNRRWMLNKEKWGSKERRDHRRGCGVIICAV